MDSNPYESPQEPDSQTNAKPREPVPYPHWLILIDVVVMAIVLAVIAAMLLPAS